MKLTLKIKLLPNPEQADLLLQTIREANAVCNRISETAWETKVFNQFRLHKEVYYPCKAAFNLRSQALVRDMDADLNAAINIATLGAAVNQPEKSGMHCTLHAA